MEHFWECHSLSLESVKTLASKCELSLSKGIEDFPNKAE